MTKEEILEILKESEVIKIANLECFSTKSDIFVYFKNMNLDSKVFETKLLQLKDKFILRGFCDKTDFTYEYTNKDNLLIEVINLKKFYETIEILSVKRNGETDLSINITNNKDNNTVISIGNKSLSLLLTEKDYAMKLRIDLGIDEIIRYQERNKNQTFNFKLTKENKKAILESYNTIDNKLVGEKTNLTFKSIYSTIYDFLENEHIEYMIEYMLCNIILEKTNIGDINRNKFKIYNRLFFNHFDRPLLDELYGSNGKISKLIESKKVLNFEQDKQKKLHI